MRLFAGFENAHGTHGMPERDQDSPKWGIKQTARTLREPVTVELWRLHLSGERPLGVIPIMQNSKCWWGSIDYDVYDGSMLELVAKVVRLKLPLVPCRSKSGGLHLFLFLADPQPAGAVLPLLRNLAALLGVSGSEIFPKQVEVLSERGDTGNWMVMPYFGGTFEGRLQEQVGMKVTGAEMTLEEFLGIAERSRLQPTDFEALASSRPAALAGSAEPVSGKRRRKTANGEPVPVPQDAFGDGPPCLQHMVATGVPQGGRNNVILMMGIYLKRRDELTWEKQLDEYNQRFMVPPLSPEEVSSAIRSLKKKEYEYTCRTPPMVSHCNSALCRSRRFGVGNTDQWPRISSLSKLNTEPAIWFVDVDGSRLEITTDDLQNYMRFHKVCMERLNRCYQLMKASDWLAIVAAVMGDVTLIEAPVDVGEAERFREYLEEFLTNRQRGETREDILSGRPWENEEENCHYFRLRDFQSFLNREGIKDVTRARITQRLRVLGGGPQFFVLKGHGTNVWFVPGEVVHSVPEVSPPVVPDAPV